MTQPCTALEACKPCEASEPGEPSEPRSCGVFLQHCLDHFGVIVGSLLFSFCFVWLILCTTCPRHRPGVGFGSLLGAFWNHYGSTMKFSLQLHIGRGGGSGPALCPLLPGFGLTFLMQALFVYQAHLNHCLAHCCNPAGLWQLTEWTRFVPTTAGFRPHIPHASTLCLPSPPKSLSCSLL